MLRLRDRLLERRIDEALYRIRGSSVRSLFLISFAVYVRITAKRIGKYEQLMYLLGSLTSNRPWYRCP